MNISSKELKKMARNQLSGKYGTFIGINVLYILITLVASNLMDLVLGTSSILNPLTATSATVETLGISHTVSQSSDKVSPNSPIRSARIFICCKDSSPEI